MCTVRTQFGVVSLDNCLTCPQCLVPCPRNKFGPECPCHLTDVRTPEEPPYTYCLKWFLFDCLKSQPMCIILYIYIYIYTYTYTHTFWSYTYIYIYIHCLKSRPIHVVWSMKWSSCLITEPPSSMRIHIPVKGHMYIYIYIYTTLFKVEKWRHQLHASHACLHGSSLVPPYLSIYLSISLSLSLYIYIYIYIYIALGGGQRLLDGRLLGGEPPERGLLLLSVVTCFIR